MSRIGGFPATFAGTCRRCDTAFMIGAMIHYTDDDELIGIDCCGEQESARYADSAFGSALFRDVDSDVHSSGGTSEQNILALTMPRGAKVKDRCLRCFQIPSSNGTCGCD